MSGRMLVADSTGDRTCIESCEKGWRRTSPGAGVPEHFLETSYQSHFATPKVEARVVTPPIRTLFDTDSDEGPQRGLECCTEWHIKRSQSFPSTLPEGDKHDRRSSKSQKGPNLEDPAVSVSEAEDLSEYKSRDLLIGSRKSKNSWVLTPVEDRFSTA